MTGIKLKNRYTKFRHRYQDFHFYTPRSFAFHEVECWMPSPEPPKIKRKK